MALMGLKSSEMTPINQWEKPMTTKNPPARPWTPDRIANGILTWHTWPGMRWYRVDLDSGRKFQFVYENDMFPGSPVAACVQATPTAPNPKCRWCKGTGKVDLATSTKECLDCWK